MDIYRVNEPFILTIFGASGDLAKLKIFPALYSLAEQKRLPGEYYIIGYARTKMTETEFRKEFKTSVEKALKKDVDSKILDNLISHVFYFSGEYDKLESFVLFRKFTDEITDKKSYPLLAYFSVPPVAFMPIIQNLGQSRKSLDEDIRLIIEKPFGRDSESAQELFHFIAQYFSENQVYLLDHYLGKSGVQSILNLRQSNRVLNLLLRGPEIANIQITAAESLGIENRVSYFEQVGIIKDMFQSHLLQILSLITMSIPISESPASLQREKYSIMSAIKILSKKDSLVLGQYDSYKKEKGVAKNTKVETFAAIKLHIDQEAWFNVPIYIRTGKKLKKKQTYVVVEFKKFAFQNSAEAPNLLIIEIAPDEKISIQLVNKYRSGSSHYETIKTSESIACAGEYCLPEHGLLLLDVIRENKLHFLSFPEILASWKVTEELCRQAEKCDNVERYKDGSIGPESQNKIPAKDGFIWHNLP